MPRSMIGPVVLAVVIATGNRADAATPDSAAATSPDSDDLRGLVSIEFSKPEYVFSASELAKGVRINYSVNVVSDVPEMCPEPQDWGHCAPAGPSGLCPFEEISGHGQSYSLRDCGRCAARPAQAVEIRKGSYPLSFEWDGRNWNGPSCTSDPKGPPFPPGTYSLKVSMAGSRGPEGKRQPYRVEKAVKVIVKD
jgi:hypothetical protein